MFFFSLFDSESKKRVKWMKKKEKKEKLSVFFKTFFAFFFLFCCDNSKSYTCISTHDNKSNK